MSRYTKKLENNRTLIYGWDHALGYFYDLCENYGTKEEKFLKERCSMFGMKRSEMAEILVENKADSSHIQKLALDLPF